MIMKMCLIKIIYGKCFVIRKCTIHINYYMTMCYLRHRKCFFVLPLSKDTSGKTALKRFLLIVSTPLNGEQWSEWSCFARMTLSSNPVPLSWNKHLPLHSLRSYNELFPREISILHADRALRGRPQWTSWQGRACLNPGMNIAKISNI